MARKRASPETQTAQPGESTDEEPRPEDVGAPKDDPAERVQQLEAERERLKQEVAATREKFLRARADYDNLAKRSDKEVEKRVQTAKAGLLLRVIDSAETLEKALGHVDAEAAKGLRLVLDQLQKLLKDEGVRRIATDDVPFNYQHHMAVERTETSDDPEGRILEVYQRGYLLEDQVLRHAMVRVAASPSKTAKQAAEGAPEST